MARKKTFNPERAVEKALDIFWRKGYEATSMQDLVDGMGLSRSSIYDTFGDKHALYLRALDSYQARESQKMFNAITEANSIRSGLQTMLMSMVEQDLSGEPCGCFIVNTTVELAPHDPAVGTRISSAAAGTEEAFFQALTRGQESGEFTPDQDARALAQFLMNAVYGLRVMSKTNPGRTKLENIVKTTLASIR